MSGFALPDGWTSVRDGERYTVITAPNIGHVTIDWHDRVFRGGAVFHGPEHSVNKYRGRHWNVRLVLDAVAWLEGMAR